MKDASFLSDRANVFGETFDEYGFSCQQLSPGAFGSPFCPPCKLLIIPSGFADPKYYKILPAIDRNTNRIIQFVENGGVLLVYGAMLTDYTYDWLPFKLSYHMKFKTQNVNVLKPEEPSANLVEQGVHDCDGYFTEAEAEVIMAFDDGTPVVVSKKLGRGYIIASSIHQYPSKKFVEWACGPDRPHEKI